MKKLLALFVILDFIFIGLIFKFNTSAPTRAISSAQDFDDFSEGQKNKWNLIKTLQFKSTDEDFFLQTDMLQMICETSSLIQLQFSAQNVAFAGAQPTISHVFSCDTIRKNQSQSKLITAFSTFKKMHGLKILALEGSELRSSQVYPDEEFPLQWQLVEINISGANTFSINKFEIEKVLLTSFQFEIPISVK